MSSPVEKFFRNHPVFTRSEFEYAMASSGSSNANTLKNILAQHVARGHIVRIKRGLFAVIPRGTDPESYPINPYLITASLANDAVIAYHSALSFYGVAYSANYRFTYLTQTKVKPLDFRNESYLPTLFPKSLQNKKLTHCFVKTEDVQGLDVQVTSKERTLVDVMDRPQLSGGWEEIWRSLEMLENLMLDDIVDYAIMLDNATTIAKVGYYLEQRKAALKIDSKYFETLQKYTPTSPHYMSRLNNDEKCQYIKHWNLMVPMSIVNLEWDEDLTWESDS